MKYPFNVYQTKVEEHIFWIAESPMLNGCVGQGETADEALKELELNEEEWLVTAKEFGIEIPDIPVEQINEYSGKFTVRVAPYVHQKAAEMAKKQNVSLNQYVNDAIVAQNYSLSSVKEILPAVAEAISKIKTMYMASSSKSSSVNSITLDTDTNVYDFDYYKQRVANN